VIRIYTHSANAIYTQFVVIDLDEPFTVGRPGYDD